MLLVPLGATPKNSVVCMADFGDSGIRFVVRLQTLPGAWPDHPAANLSIWPSWLSRNIFRHPFYDDITRLINDLKELAGQMTMVPTGFNKGVAAAMAATTAASTP